MHGIYRLLKVHVIITRCPHQPDKQTETYSILFSFMAATMFFIPADKTVVGPEK
jgi:hypothetical protein